MHVKVIRNNEEFKELKVQWNELLFRSSSQSVFLTWEWVFTWWEVYVDQSRQLHIVCFLEGNLLVGILPCVITKKQRRQFSFNTLEFLGTGEAEIDEVCSNYLDVILDPAYEHCKKEMADYILSGFKGGLWEQFEISNTAVNSYVDGMVQQYLKANLSQEVLTTGSCAIIDLPDNWNDYMSTLSKKWRDQIKRGRKELEQKGAIRTAVIQNENDLEDALKAFIVLHQKKWESQGGKGLFGSSKFLRFHQDVIKRLTAVGQVYFHQLYCADRLVATSYMLTYKDTRYFYLPAYDYSFEMKIGLGLIERSYDIERSTGEKIKFYDFYRAPEGSYKWHMAKEKKDIVSYLSANQTGKYFWYQTFRSTKRAAKRVIDLCRGKKN